MCLETFEFLTCSVFVCCRCTVALCLRVSPVSPMYVPSRHPFLCNFDSKMSNFYALPKVHKSSIINLELQKESKIYYEICCPKDLTFRPIVAGPICITSHLSELMDIIMKPLTKHIQSFTKDTWDFLEFLPREINDDSTLMTLDVKSLYTNINHEVGLEAIEYWIRKFPHLIPERFSINFIKEGINLVLKNNLFKFHSEVFSQIKGTAMGTKMAPTYATLVLGFLEETKLYPKIEELYGQETLEHFKKSYRRFLDDCFLIKKRHFGSSSTLLKVFNNLHSDFEFTMEERKDQISFLDVLIIKKGTKLSTDVFYKPTDGHLYLHFNSCHPGYVKRSIPYNMIKRIDKIVSDPIIKKERFQEMKSFLLAQNYPENLIDDAIVKVEGKEQRHRLKRDPYDCIPFVTSFNPNNVSVDSSIKLVFDNLQKCKETRESFRNKTLILCKRQDQSNKKLLTQALFEENGSTDKPTVKKCNDKRCKTCQHIIEGSILKIDKKIIKINESMTCTSRNLIYYMKCNGCLDGIYIGETGDTLRHRVTVHRQQINTEYVRNLNVSKHIWDCAKNMEIKFQIMPIFKMRGNTPHRRLKEKEWIEKLNPKLNQS